MALYDQTEITVKHFTLNKLFKKCIKFFNENL